MLTPSPEDHWRHNQRGRPESASVVALRPIVHVRWNTCYVPRNCGYGLVRGARVVVRLEIAQCSEVRHALDHGMRLSGHGCQPNSALARPAPLRSAMSSRDANSCSARYADIANEPLVKAIKSIDYVD